MRYVVHRGTGTIMDASECVILETDLDWEEDEAAFLDLADAEGRPV